MKNALIINAHHPYPFSQGKLSAALVDRIAHNLTSRGFEVEHTATSADYDIEQEVEKHRWADLIVIQAPLNWFSIPWPLKKYMDEVYTAGLDGRVCKTDGRTSDRPKENYGTGGTLTGRKFMLSMTLNAPKEAFDNPTEVFMQGKSIDDLMLHVNSNYRFLGMETLPTFACFDVIKNPTIDEDFARLDAYLDEHVHSVVSN
ncbi:NAD(P)H-dependent oxidoreductase [Vibrio navarrensis]